MKTYRFAYGSGTVEFPLEEKNIIGELHGNVVEPISDIRRELWASLDAPIDSAPLCRRVTADAGHGPGADEPSQAADAG